MFQYVCLNYVHLSLVAYFQNEPYNHRDHVLVADLINLYTEVFPENPKEMEQEKMMLQVLKKYSNQPHGNLNNVKVSGEFRVWIYLHNKKGETYNIAVSIVLPDLH